MRIPVTKNQADAIRQDIMEINQLQDVLQTKMQHNKRMTDMLVRDADLDPKDFQNYQLVEEKGKVFMELKPVPKPEAAPVPTQTTATPANQ